MEVIRSAAEMREWALARPRAGRATGLVPTMGALHAGHLALIEAARAQSDAVVVSIFVNPAQFDRASDLETYPRTFEQDCDAARKAGTDIVFAPGTSELYPDGYQTYVEVEEIQKSLCGATRPGHFRGVATVVLKLLNLVRPAKAFFGWKDAQQLLLLRRMVRDLNVPVELIGVETVREPDGLALSSRNVNLSDEERRLAPDLHLGLEAIRGAALEGETEAEILLTTGRGFIERSGKIKIDYLEMVAMDRLGPIERVEPGNTMVAVAAFLGRTRLIDNIRF